MLKKTILLTMLAGAMGIKAQIPDGILSDQQLQTEIEAAITAEFGSYDNQSPLFAKAIEKACDFYDVTNCDAEQACTFAIQALRHAHNVLQIDAFYYITGASVIFFGKLPEQALALIATHANNNKEDDKVDMNAYPEIKNMIMQKTGSSQESKRYVMHAINFVKMGITLQEIDSLTTLIASSNHSHDIDFIDEIYYLYFTAVRYSNATHQAALFLVKMSLGSINASLIG